MDQDDSDGSVIYSTPTSNQIRTVVNLLATSTVYDDSNDVTCLSDFPKDNGGKMSVSDDLFDSSDDDVKAENVKPFLNITVPPSDQEYSDDNESNGEQQSHGGATQSECILEGSPDSVYMSFAVSPSEYGDENGEAFDDKPSEIIHKNVRKSAAVNQLTQSKTLSTGLTGGVDCHGTNSFTPASEEDLAVETSKSATLQEIDSSSLAGLNLEGNKELDESVINLSYQNLEETSVVDLTQSDTSLQNSPIGASRQLLPKQRSMTDIVTELSAVSNDLMVKETLLETVNISHLPDKGQNLMGKVQELKRRKQNLEKELHLNDELKSQESGLHQFQKAGGSRQNLLPATVKDEPRAKLEYFDDEMEENEGTDSQPVKDFNESTMPDWGDLPLPGMAISGFGKQAMKTHLTEKSLTLEALSQLHKALRTCPAEDVFVEDPKYLKVELMPHQKHGLAWMLWREQEIPSGGILADDMGLGKTISMISLILKDVESKENSDDNESYSNDDSPEWMSSRYSRMPSGGTLVVCPASLIDQWAREIHKRVKRRALTVDLYHGAAREMKPRRLANKDVVITTYNLVGRESGAETGKNCTRIKNKGPLFLIKWNRIILDEAHIVRNHKSLMALGVCELVAKHRWCLTGTPIHNKELDLFALLKFLKCSPFDDIIVWKKWVDNKSAAGMQRLNTMMKSLMLRRTKEQLQEKGDLSCLPEKTFEQIDVHLDPEELEVYEKVALFSKTLFAQFLYQKAEKQQALDAKYGVTTKPVWEHGTGPDNQFTTTEELAMMHRQISGITDVKAHHILVLLLRLRQICCHPGLVRKMVEDGDLDCGGVEDAAGLDVDLFNQMNNLNINESSSDDLNEGHDNKSCTITVDHPSLNLGRPSTKIRAVLDLIQDKLLDTDDKAIIVSQWTSMLEIIAEFLKDMHVKFDTLSGKVPVDKRQEIVNSFNKEFSGPQILLLSLTAGGVGLNLMGANHLLLIDIHWNPQLEAQACDRIYRVGQKKNIFIYRFITVETIEERIKKLQDQKLALADNVLTGTRNTQASKLTLDDLKMLFAPSLHNNNPDNQNT